MVFNSLIYAIYLPIVLAVYFQLKHKIQNRFLLVASYVFYGWWDPRFLTLLAFSTVVDFTVASRMYASDDPVVRKRWLWLSLGTNLGILGLFKYFGFFADTFQQMALAVGWHPGDVTLHIVLPVGISFYTFQTLAYTIDIYRNDLKPTDDFWDFALYVSFFPQLVAGPIERAQALLPQISLPRKVELKDLQVGIALILIGLLRKVGIADAVAQPVNNAFADPQHFSQTHLMLALYLFSLQIYGDFAGYSSIARGSARLLGVKLMRNFDQPYLSTSITEFWRRWHRSLSFWLRDYLYITLGGNRGGTFRTYRNLMLTMLIGGLWHGASWAFVFWGALHGAGLAIHKAWVGERRKLGPVWSSAIGIIKGVAGIFLTFHLVLFAWLFFRAGDLATSYRYLAAMCYGPWRLGAEWQLLWQVLAYGLMTLVIDVIQASAKSHTPMLNWPRPMVVVSAVVALVWIISLGGIDVNVEFIYFQF